MSTDTAVAVTRPDIDVIGSALEPYGNRDLIREMVDRLMTFHPASKDVGKEGMFQAAQLAILMGASPLPGLNEIHIWKDNKDKVNVTPGINYWRRRGEQKGGVRWVERPRPMTNQERETYGVPDTQLAAICRGMRTSEYHACRDEGMSYAQADSACSVIGIGIVAKTEYAKAGRPLIWTAIKHAETDFYKRAFPYIPGEGLPGAGMTRDEAGRFAPDFAANEWQMELPPAQRELPAGASIDWLRDGAVVRAEQAARAAAIEGELIDDEPPEPPSWETLTTDLRAVIEESETVTLLEVATLLLQSPAFGQVSAALDVTDVLCAWPEFNGKQPLSGTPIKRAAALRLFDWASNIDPAELADLDETTAGPTPAAQ